MIFSETTLQKLRQLHLVAARVRSGAFKGERRSSRRGSSVEFADYRDYTPGDDLRRLDWNIYARLEKPFIKLLEDEEDLAVVLLIDGSQSMDWGQGVEHKFTYALHLAAGLGSIALAGGEALSAYLLQDGTISSSFRPARGETALSRLFRYLETLQPGGETALNSALEQYNLGAHRPGLVFLLSDLLDPKGCQAGLRTLLGRGNEVVLLHILAPDELDPPLAGDLQLVDIENEQTQDVSLDGGLRSLYRQRVDGWMREIQSDCRRRGIRWLALPTSQPWDQVILREMRRNGVVK
ncbi:MAG: DUF58 domain-containing protein [Anaerolineales bacterium]|nr:DUF58 domain-containing protein [Anaerolineales bacterium]